MTCRGRTVSKIIMSLITGAPLFFFIMAGSARAASEDFAEGGCPRAALGHRRFEESIREGAGNQIAERHRGKGHECAHREDAALKGRGHLRLPDDLARSGDEGHVREEEKGAGADRNGRCPYRRQTNGEAGQKSHEHDETHLVLCALP